MSKVDSENLTYKYWWQFERNEPRRSVSEVKLYTDATILGQASNVGPFSLINTIAHADPNIRKSTRAAIVLRVAFHQEQIEGPMRPGEMTWKDDFDHYHGGDFFDEMAALVSLFLGIRVKAGPVDREFTEHGDPYGTPIQYDPKPIPDLLTSTGASQIPQVRGHRNLEELKALESFPRQGVLDANTLVKAARIYQQAVWICDSDPALAWLLFISAVETVAVRWAGDIGTAREKLEAGLPKVFDLLAESQCAHLIDPMAELLATYTKATKKFIEFLLAFSPPEPSQRPAEFLRLSFERKHLQKAFGVIYGHRSASLHGGTAFPLPMCQPPTMAAFAGKQDTAYQEVPMGMAMRAYGATWHRETTPMLLHTFEYIARGAITSWWKSLAPNE